MYACHGHGTTASTRRADNTPITMLRLRMAGLEDPSSCLDCWDEELVMEGSDLSFSDGGLPFSIELVLCRMGVALSLSADTDLCMMAVVSLTLELDLSSCPAIKWPSATDTPKLFPHSPRFTTSCKSALQSSCKAASPKLQITTTSTTITAAQFQNNQTATATHNHLPLMQGH